MMRHWVLSRLNDWSVCNERYHLLCAHLPLVIFEFFRLEHVLRFKAVQELQSIRPSLSDGALALVAIEANIILETAMRVDSDPLIIWGRFQEIFKSTAEVYDPREWVAAWTSNSNRTKFMKIFLNKVALTLGLTVEHELWRVDFALSVISENGFKVPVIFVESENNIKDVNRAGGEVRKLCCHSAPLKVLITVGMWDETPSVWKGRAIRTQYLTGWQAMVREHADQWPHRGLFGVIVGEWSDLNETCGRLRFYANAIQPDGSLLFPEEDLVIFEREGMRPSLANSL
jgi:hypothetical protein